MVGNHIKVYWNGNLIIDYIDKTMSPKLASEKIAMYSEDAYVVYDNIDVLKSNYSFFNIAPESKVLGMESSNSANVLLLLRMLLRMLLSFSFKDVV